MHDENKVETEVKTLGSIGAINETVDVEAQPTAQEAPAETVTQRNDQQEAIETNQVDEPVETDEADHDQPATSENISKELDEALNAITEGHNETAQKAGQKEELPKPSAPDEQKTKDAEEDKKPESEEDEEAAIMALAGNERSRERFKKILNERKEAKEIAQSFVEQIQGAGYDQSTFAQVLEFGRLISSNDINQKRTALSMLDKVRANLAADIGEEVPGVDLLKDYPDLQKAVGEMNLDRKQALEVAAARRKQQELQKQQAMQAQQVQLRDRFKVGQETIMNTLTARQGEPNFVEKVQAISEWLRMGDNLQNFVMSVPPEQWATQINAMMDKIPARFYQPVSAQAKARVQQPEPLRSRPANIGVRDTSKLKVDEYAMDLMKDL